MIAGILVTLLLLVSLWVGWTSRRAAAHPDGYFLAGRGLSQWSLAMLVVASALSGSLVLSGPALQYRFGFSTMMLVLPAAASFGLAFYFLAGRLQSLAAKQHLRTLPEALGFRLDSTPVRLTSATLILFGAVGYLVTQTLLLGQVLAFALNLPVVAGILIGTLVTGGWHLSGGLVASKRMSMPQVILMMLAGFALLATALSQGKGMPNMITTIVGQVGDFADPIGGVGSGVVIGWYFIFCIGLVGQPQVVSKFLMVSDRRQLRWSALIAAAAALAIGMIWMALGTWMRFAGSTGITVDNSEWGIMTFVAEQAPAPVSGLFLLAAVAACMSTMSAFLGVATAAIAIDIPDGFDRRPLPEQQILSGRVSGGCLLLLAAVVAIAMPGSVRWFATFGWSMLAAALVPVLTIGLSWKRTTARSAMFSMIAGAGTSVLFEVSAFVPEIPDVLPGHVYPGVIALVISTLVLVTLSMSVKTPPVRTEIMHLLDGGNPAMRP